MPSVAVVFVTYRTKSLVLRALDALAGTGGDGPGELEVVVVDNASDDGTVEGVRAAHPEVVVLDNGSNIGFPAAVNQGVAATRADAVLVLNADVVVTPAQVAELAARLWAEPDVGMVVPAQIDAAGLPQPIIRRDVTPGRLAVDALLLGDLWRDRVRPRPPTGTAPIEVDWAVGAAMMIRRSAFDAVGGFDAQVFMYGEEHDFQRRLRSAGWRVEVLPSVAVTHVGGASSRDAARDDRLATSHRSTLYFLAKHHGTVGLLIGATVLTVSGVLRWLAAWVVGRLTGRRGRQRPFARALAVTASPVEIAAARRRARVQRPHVVVLDHATGIGGGQRTLVDLLPRLVDLGLRVTMAAPPTGVIGALSDERVGTVAWTPARLRGIGGALRFPLEVARTALMVRRRRANVVVVNTVRAALVGLPAAGLAGVPAVWYCHDRWLSEDPPARPGPQLRLIGVLQRLSAVTVAVSADLAAHLPRPAVVVHDAIDPGRLGPPRSDEHSATAAPVLLHAGRMVAMKGAEVALRVAERVQTQHGPVRLVLAGGVPLGEDPGHAQRIREMADASPVEVELPGHVEDLAALMRDADLLLATGQPETFGLVVGEAMALGTPAVGFAHGALPEVVGSDESPGPAAPAGVVVPADDVDALTRAVVELLGDPERRAALGAAGRRRARERFGVGRQATQMAAVLRAVAG